MRKILAALSEIKCKITSNCIMSTHSERPRLLASEFFRGDRRAKEFFPRPTQVSLIRLVPSDNLTDLSLDCFSVEC